MNLFDLIYPLIENIEPHWTSKWFKSKTRNNNFLGSVLCFNFPSFNINFYEKEGLMYMDFSVEDTSILPSKNSLFVSNLCKEIIYNDFTMSFSRELEPLLMHYLTEKGNKAFYKNESLLNSLYEKMKDLIPTLEEKIAEHLHKNSDKFTVIIEDKYSDHYFCYFDVNKNNEYLGNYVIEIECKNKYTINNFKLLINKNTVDILLNYNNFNIIERMVDHKSNINNFVARLENSNNISVKSYIMHQRLSNSIFNKDFETIKKSKI